MSQSEPMEVPQFILTLGDSILAALEKIATQEGPGVQTLSVTESEVPGGFEVDFPAPGTKRWLVQRSAVGGAFAVGAALVDLLGPNNRRLGGAITNGGVETVTLTLAPAASAATQGGLGQIVLLPGGSWDFRLGSLVWCGSVAAIAGGAGATVVHVVEV